MSLNLEGLVGESTKGKVPQLSTLLANLEVDVIKPQDTLDKKKTRKRKIKISHASQKKVEQWLAADNIEPDDIDWHDGYYLEYLRKRAARERMMLYVVRHHNEVHIFRSKTAAAEYSLWAERDMETLRTEDYFWLVRPGFVLIAHDLTHRQLIVQPNGAVLVRLRPRRNVDSLKPMRYSSEEIIALRARFQATLKPNLHSLAKNPELVNYVLNCLGIHRSWREEQKFLQCLQNVFDMSEFAAFGSNISDAEPIENYIVSHGGRRLRKNRRLIPNETYTFKIDGPTRRKPIESKANWLFRDIPEITFPRTRRLPRDVKCKAQWDALRRSSE
jgi:hypothetical protein